MYPENLCMFCVRCTAVITSQKLTLAFSCSIVNCILSYIVCILSLYGLKLRSRHNWYWQLTSWLENENNKRQKSHLHYSALNRFMSWHQGHLCVCLRIHVLCSTCLCACARLSFVFPGLARRVPLWLINRLITENSTQSQLQKLEYKSSNNIRCQIHYSWHLYVCHFISLRTWEKWR